MLRHTRSPRSARRARWGEQSPPAVITRLCENVVFCLPAAATPSDLWCERSFRQTPTHIRTRDGAVPHSAASFFLFQTSNRSLFAIAWVCNRVGQSPPGVGNVRRYRTKTILCLIGRGGNDLYENRQSLRLARCERSWTLGS